MVLKDIDIAIPKGTLTAIVGPVGSGKSSLIGALLGELEVDSGEVNVGGKVAYVPQQAWMQGPDSPSKSFAYRVILMVMDLGWIVFQLDVISYCSAAQPVLPFSHRPKQNHRKILKQENSSQPNPGSRPPVSPCIRMRFPACKNG